MAETIPFGKFEGDGLSIMTKHDLSEARCDLLDSYESKTVVAEWVEKIDSKLKEIERIARARGEQTRAHIVKRREQISLMSFEDMMTSLRKGVIPNAGGDIHISRINRDSYGMAVQYVVSLNKGDEVTGAYLNAMKGYSRRKY